MQGVIITPYRNRFEHRCKFVLHMKTNYPHFPIKIIEQADDKPFNRGKLLNIGFMENPDFDYYALSDIDMLCESDVSVYNYPKRPTHIATEVEQFDYKMPFREYFGGVVLFSKEQFRQVNGFSNIIYGWGLEDSELRRELHWKGMKIDRRKGRFRSLPHEPNGHYTTEEYKANEILLKNGRPKEDGLKHCHYQILERTDFKDYELIKVLL